MVPCWGGVVGLKEGGSGRPGIFAVGGGAIPVRLTGVGCCFFVGVLSCCRVFPIGDFVGVWPPYLSSSCWVELYFVASLSLLMASSRCLFKWLR